MLPLSAIVSFALVLRGQRLPSIDRRSGNVKAMQPFFRRPVEAVSSLWTTNYQAGGLVGDWGCDLFADPLWLAEWPSLVRRCGSSPLVCWWPCSWSNGLEPQRGFPCWSPNPSSLDGAQPDTGPTLLDLLRMQALWTLGLPTSASS